MLDTSAIPARKSHLLIHPAATVLLLKGKLFASYLHQLCCFYLCVVTLLFYFVLSSLFDLCLSDIFICVYLEYLPSKRTSRY